MELRFYIDPETDEPHIFGHGVSEAEVEAVLARPLEDRLGEEGSQVALGQTVNDQWRIVFRCVNADAHDVKVIDYH